MRTYFKMIEEFADFSPANRGVTSFKEVRRVASHFGLDTMTELELLNLRDMVVLVYDRWLDDAMDDFPAQRKLMDAMQSVTSVIDYQRNKLNAEE